MEIKIKFEIGMTPDVAAFAGKLLQALGHTPAPQRGTAPDGLLTSDIRQTETTEPQTEPDPARLPPEEPEPIEAQVPEPKDPPIEHEPGPDGVIPPTDKEMRDMMDITISRLAGNGWKESNDPKTLTIRKGCTKVFKQIAAHLGAEKPTGLVDGKRTEFCKELDNIYIDTKDNSVEWKVF